MLPPSEVLTRPVLGWSAGRLLVPSPWQNQDPEWHYPLVTLDEPGHIGPLASQGWSALVRWDSAQESSACDLTAHGFQITNNGTIKATAWMAAGGIMVLDLPAGMNVELRSDESTVERQGIFQEVEVEGCSICLGQLNREAGLRAVLATRTTERESLRRLVEHWLEASARTSWEASQAPLASFWAGQVQGQPGALPALARAVDDLTACLRIPCGVIPFWWSLGRAENGQGQLTDDLYAQVRAWSWLHPPVAAALVKTALSAQRDDGAIPRIVRPDGFHDMQWAPCPLLARSAWMAWQAEPNREFYDYVMPRLHRYLMWAITYYDPEWRGLPVWRNPREAWTPETYNPLVASADLPAMLAAELDALRDLARAVPSGSPPQEDFSRYRASLSRTLSGFFWNKDATMFQDRFPAGDHVIRLTLSATLPLLDTSLSRDTLQPVAERLDRGGSLRDPGGVREWSVWPDDPELPPVREDHQLLVLDALDGAGERETANNLRQDLAQRHATEPARRLEPQAAALRVITLGRPVQPAQPFAMISPLLTLLDRHRAAVLISAFVGVLLLMGSVIFGFMFKRSVTVQTAETSYGLARRLYQEQHYEESRAMLLEILGSGRTFPGIQHQLGNTDFQLGRWEDAESAYRAELKRDPNAVNASLNLALTLLKQQRRLEAIAIYQEVTNRFAKADPTMANRAALALRLLQEQPHYLPTEGVFSGGEKE